MKRFSLFVYFLISAFCAFSQDQQIGPPQGVISVRGSLRIGSAVHGDKDQDSLATITPSGQVGAMNAGIYIDSSRFLISNQYFDDGKIGVFSSKPALRIGDVLYGIINEWSTQPTCYTKITEYGDGTIMTDAKIDGHIYRKRGSEYFRLVYELYSVKLWGAIGNGTHDDRQAFKDAMNGMPRALDVGISQPTPTGFIYVPFGRYFLSDSIRLGRVCVWWGAGGFLGSGCQLVFGANKHGFEVMRYNSHSIDTAGHTINYGATSRAADGTIFANISISQQDTTNGVLGTVGVGIWCRATCLITNCSIVSWPSMGVFECANVVSVEDAFKIKHVYMANDGTEDFTTEPTITWTNSSGHGLVMHGVLGGRITTPRMTDPGLGYVELPHVVRVKEFGDYLESNVQLRGYGADLVVHMGLDTATVTNGGVGYTFANAVVNSPSGAGAVVHCVVSGGKVIAIVIDDPGLDYLQIATMSIIITGDGVGATARPEFLRVVSLTVHSAGKNYEKTDIPRVYIRGGRRGFGHDATAVIDSLNHFRLKRIPVDNEGDSFYQPPKIIITPSHGAVAWSTRYGDEGGNANRWKIRDSRMDNNGYGLFVVGSDVNAGGAWGCDFSDNKLYGCLDNSFLGPNTYLNCHTNGNGWGPYASYSNTARNKFINCYSEGNQPPAVGINPAEFDGGIMGAGVAGTAKTDNSPLSIDRISVDGAGELDLTIAGDQQLGEILSWTTGNQDPGSVARLTADPETGDVKLFYYDQPFTRDNFDFTAPNTKSFFGHSVPQPYVGYIPIIETGTTDVNARQIGTSPSFPPLKGPFQTDHARGDFFVNTQPVLDADSTYIFGWIGAKQSATDTLYKDWYPIMTSAKVHPFTVTSGGGGGSGGSATYLSINTQAGAYTLQLSDTSTVVRINTSSNVNVTIPNNSSVGFRIGTQIIIAAVGTGQVTLVPGSGVTLNSAGGALKTRTQYSTISEIQTATNQWLVSGDLSN